MIWIIRCRERKLCNEKNCCMYANNERLPNKNIKKFDDGDPLLTYMLNTLTKIEAIDEIYVYCSSDEIKKYLPENVKFLKRDPKFDKDTASINELLKSFAQKISSEIYILAHATAPFVSKEKIEEGITKVQSKKFDSAFTVKEIQEFLWRDNKPINYNLDNIPRTQDLQPIYSETSGIYIYAREVIEKYNRRIGKKPYLIKVSAIEAIDIDNIEDFQIANAVYSKLLKDKIY